MARVFSRNGKWWLDYSFEGCRIRKCEGTNKRFAEDALRAILTDIQRGRYQFKKRSEVRFDTFAETYLAHAKVNKVSWKRDQKVIEKTFSPFFANRNLSGIQTLFIESLKEKRKSEVRPGTVNREMNILRRMFTLAVQWKMLSENPMKGISFLRVDNFPERILSQEETKKLLEACTDYSRPIVLTALHTGMRKGEILGLKWEQVDLREKVITVLHTKNGRLRKLPVNNTLLETLKDLKKKAKSDSVFVCTRTREPAQRFQVAWANALKKSGIPHCRFHDLRHNFGSQMVAGGVDLATVKELLGHANIATTSRYLHAAPENKLKAMAVIEQRLGQKDAKSWHQVDTNEKLQVFEIRATA